MPSIASLGTRAADTLIVADGFSCCEQIEQGTGHGTLHLVVRN
jgi:hypothetical protein